MLKKGSKIYSILGGKCPRCHEGNFFKHAFTMNIFKVNKTSIEIEGSIKARKYYLDGNVSSQFFSGLMFSLPLLKKDSYIYLNTKLESKSYIDLTIEVLEKINNERKIKSPSNLQFKRI